MKKILMIHQKNEASKCFWNLNNIFSLTKKTTNSVIIFKINMSSPILKTLSIIC